MAFLDSILSEKQNYKAYLTFSDEVKIVGVNVGIPSVREQEEACQPFTSGAVNSCDVDWNPQKHSCDQTPMLSMMRSARL
mmetsp:Transcript_14255/g.16330  ORF Transcript_14255/g.16330 Transcript_14255/m.16330 type:complete len:80 (-) Transcript_14255:248-487(-)